MKVDLNLKVDAALRVVWVSEEARLMWASWFREIPQLVYDMEIETVARGLRKASWQTVHVDKVPELVIKMAERGLIAAPVKYVGKWTGYSNYVVPRDPKSGDFNVNVIIARTKGVIDQYIKAYSS